MTTASDEMTLPVNKSLNGSTDDMFPADKIVHPKTVQQFILAPDQITPEGDCSTKCTPSASVNSISSHVAPNPSQHDQLKDTDSPLPSVSSAARFGSCSNNVSSKCNAQNAQVLENALDKAPLRSHRSPSYRAYSLAHNDQMMESSLLYDVSSSGLLRSPSWYRESIESASSHTQIVASELNYATLQSFKSPLSSLSAINNISETALSNAAVFTYVPTAAEYNHCGNRPLFEDSFTNIQHIGISTSVASSLTSHAHNMNIQTTSSYNKSVGLTSSCEFLASGLNNSKSQSIKSPISGLSAKPRISDTALCNAQALTDKSTPFSNSLSECSQLLSNASTNSTGSSDIFASSVASSHIPHADLMNTRTTSSHDKPVGSSSAYSQLVTCSFDNATIDSFTSHSSGLPTNTRITDQYEDLPES